LSKDHFTQLFKTHRDDVIVNITHYNVT